MKSILIIDNYDSFTYNLVHLLEEIPGIEVIVRRNDALEPKDAAMFDGILFSPGPGLPGEAGKMPELIRYFKLNKPMLGVCLGHQAIGEAFGGQLQNLERVYHGIQSTISITQNQTGLFKKMPSKISVGRYHSWVVSQTRVPTDFRVTALAEDDTIMAMEHVSLPIYGVQFHPESIMTPEGKQIIENWIATF